MRDSKLSLQAFNYKHLLAISAWGYLFFALAIWLIVLIGGDRWWPATLILFGPRWVAALPGVVLLPFAIRQNRRLLIPVLIGFFVVLGPFMGLSIPLGRVLPAHGSVLRVLTCNLHSGAFNEAALADVIRKSGADIVVLQECSPELKLGRQIDWYFVREGGLAILSRYPFQSGGSFKALPLSSRWLRTYMLYQTILAPGGAVTLCSVHFPTARYGLKNILDRQTLVSPSRKDLLIEETEHRRKISRDVQQVVSSLPAPVIVAGDFNMPVESTIYRQHWNGYSNSFSKVGFGYGMTQMVSVHGINFGVRIDHILTGEGVKARYAGMGANVESDHRPLIADICRATTP